MHALLERHNTPTPNIKPDADHPNPDVQGKSKNSTGKKSNAAELASFPILLYFYSASFWLIAHASRVSSFSTIGFAHGQCF
jgi:hypothetical protein